MRIAVLADTHIPKRAKNLPDSAWKILEYAETILHAAMSLPGNFSISCRRWRHYMRCAAITTLT
jgi:hypothetical protein